MPCSNMAQMPIYVLIRYNPKEGFIQTLFILLPEQHETWKCKKKKETDVEIIPKKKAK